MTWRTQVWKAGSRSWLARATHQSLNAERARWQVECGAAGASEKSALRNRGAWGAPILLPGIPAGASGDLRSQPDCRMGRKGDRQEEEVLGASVLSAGHSRPSSACAAGHARCVCPRAAPRASPQHHARTPRTEPGDLGVDERKSWRATQTSLSFTQRTRKGGHVHSKIHI